MAEKDEYGRPIEYPQTRESGSDSSLEEAIKGIDVVAIDARSYMSPLELLKHAATGSKPKRVGKLVGSAYNATSVEAAKEILRNVVTEADGGLYSLLCRQVYDRAIAAEQARLDAIEQQFKDTVLQVFNLADLDGSGVLEYTELRAIAQSDHEAEAILSHLDKDSNGAVSEDEWVDFFLALQKTNPALVQVLLERTVRMIFERDFMNVCRSLFHEFDQDGSGQLELNEILVMMGDDEHGRDFLQYADTNGSSSLTLDEWQSFFLGFWRYHPQMARHNVGFLMGRAAELRSMPSLPPVATAA